jgi:uncharacterized protein YutE (UPF0331/DUF86 family)
VARNRILPDQLPTGLARMVLVRKCIVHGYTSVDFELLGRDLPAGIAAQDRLAAALATRLGPPPPP